MAIQPLNNEVPLLEQRTKINENFAELDARGSSSLITASRDIASTDKGRVLTNALSSNYSLTNLAAGVGMFALAQSGAGTLTVQAGTGVTINGGSSFSTSAIAPWVFVIEEASGVYLAYDMYTLPSGGIPSGHMSTAVQAALTAAGTALQSVSSASLTDSTSVGRALITAANQAAAQAAMGLGSAATHAATDFATSTQGTKADGALQAANNLSDLLNAVVARANLGLGSAATHASTDFDAAGAATTAQAAAQAYTDSKLTNIWTAKGTIDASSNPNYPAATAGWVYVISAAGKIGGASGKAVDVGDFVFCNTTNAGGTDAAVGASWSIFEHNLVGALLAGNNLSDLTNPSTARANLGAAPAGTGAGGAYQTSDVIGLTTALATKETITPGAVTTNGTLSAGGAYVNGGAADYTLTIPVGLGKAIFHRGLTNNLLAAAGAGVTLTGLTTTSTGNPLIVFTEFSTGTGTSTYRGDGIGAGSSLTSTVITGYDTQGRITQYQENGVTFNITYDSAGRVYSVLQA